LGINFFETSAKMGHNVDHAFFGNFFNPVLFLILLIIFLSSCQARFTAGTPRAHSSEASSGIKRPMYPLLKYNQFSQ